MEEDFKLDIKMCPRCEKSHDKLLLWKFGRPVQKVKKVSRPEDYHYYANCPVTGDPILFRTVFVAD